MAGIYNGHLLEFPQIRVDCFTTPTPARPHLLPPPDPSSSTAPWRPAPHARLYLLTHVHTDHLVGLSSAFTGTIICSPDTKRMLLRLEAEIERERVDGGIREGRVLKYEGLRARTVGQGKMQRKIDMIQAIPYGHPTEFELGYEHGEPYKVTITLLDANHCPGSTMFLIKSQTKAVLHTGDVRADTAFIQSLRVNPALAEFIEPATTYPSVKTENEVYWGKRVLDRIYLDTSAVLGTGDMPDREPVLTELVEQMAMYPEDTIFFLNVWCFGWEHVVKAVARHFRSPVHVDRYKRSIYGAIQADPFLLACTDTNPSITRFHACERRFKCDHCRTFDRSGKRVWNGNKRVVHVNMVEVKSAAWEVQQLAFREKLGLAACGEAEWPFNIECPIARHSPLPELQALVQLFCPAAVSPNCVVPTLSGLDYFLLPNFLDGLLQPGGYARMISERDAWFASPACFIRNGAERLAFMKQQQAIGYDLLALVDLGGGNTNDDYLPGLDAAADAKSAPFGGSRRDHASDQALRAGGLLHGSGCSLLPAVDVTFSQAFKDAVATTHGMHGDAPADDLSDTDQEDRVDRSKRSTRGHGKRKHLVSPSVARSRVLSLQQHHYGSSIHTKRLKTDPEPSKQDKLSINSSFDTNPPNYAYSAEHPCLSPAAGRLPNTREPRDDNDNMGDKRPLRYLVDGQHLAALMAVGDAPTSPG